MTNQNLTPKRPLQVSRSQQNYRWQSLHARLLIVVCLVCAPVLSGCRMLQTYGALPQQPGFAADQPQYANPLVVPMIDRWAVMDFVSDEVDNYFTITREERIGHQDGILTEGWIETAPRIGSSLLEPWHRDSTPGFEKLHSTLQTIQRYAKVRVIPTGNHYQIDVKVYKELEDLPQPLGSGVGGKLLRHDIALDIDRERPLNNQPNEGWIPMGRDLSLEQAILHNLQAKITGACEAN